MHATSTLVTEQQLQKSLSVYSSVDNVIPFALDALERGEEVCLVTLVGIDGSAPRAIGAQMAVTETGESAGSFTGGCLEGSVVSEAIQAISVREARLVRYGKGSAYIDIVLPCGSGLDLHFDPNPDRTKLQDVMNCVAARRPATITLDIGPTKNSSDQRTFCGSNRYFDCNYLPKTRLGMAGDSASSFILARLATEVGIEVLDLNVANQDQLEKAFDQWTALVLLFHEHEKEREILRCALNSKCFYIGALGSHATQKARRRWLLQDGIPEHKIAEVHAPIGMIPGAKSPAELAVSVLADVVASARQLSL